MRNTAASLGVPASSARPDAILHEAAVWLARLADGELDAQEWESLRAWRARSAAHERAWQQAELLRGRIADVPPMVGRTTLEGAAQIQNAGRRRALKTALPIFVAMPSVYLVWQAGPWRGWGAQYRTAVGEWRAFDLPDGTRMVLDTASAADIDYDANRRQVELRVGEVLLETSARLPRDERPFLVRTPHGIARALGTRFVVRIAGERTEVAVSDGAVQIVPKDVGQAQVLPAGHRGSFSRADATRAQAFEGEIGVWSEGILNADDTRLADFLAELSRYRRGVLRCDPAVADLRISGSFQLRDTTQALLLLERSFPVRVRMTNPLWTMVEARPKT